MQTRVTLCVMFLWAVPNDQYATSQSPIHPDCDAKKNVIVSIPGTMPPKRRKIKHEGLKVFELEKLFKKSLESNKSYSSGLIT